jgi:hypothetical protein
VRGSVDGGARVGAETWEALTEENRIETTRGLWTLGLALNRKARRGGRGRLVLMTGARHGMYITLGTQPTSGEQPSWALSGRSGRAT